MTEHGAELARFAEVTGAREASRRLLAAGLGPGVHRDGREHVLTVPPDQAEAAAAVLAIDPATVIVTTDAPPEPGSADAVPVDADAPVEALDEWREFIVDDRGFVVVATADDAEAARAVAAQLIGEGIGSEVRSAFETGHANPMVSPSDPQVVQVLEVDTDRALRVLGVDEVPPRLTAPPVLADGGAGADGPGVGDGGVTTMPGVGLRKRTEPEEVRSYLGGRVTLTRRQLRTILALYLAALVLIPLAFFLLSRWVLSPEIEEPEIPSRGFDAVVPGVVVALPDGLRL